MGGSSYEKPDTREHGRDDARALMRELQRLHETSVAVAAATEPAAAMQAVLNSLLAAIGGAKGLVGLGAGPRRETVASAGFKEGEVRSLEETPAAWGRWEATGSRLVVADAVANPVFDDAGEVVRRGGMRAWHGVGLRLADGEVAGVLLVGFEEPHRPDACEERLTDLYAQLAVGFIAKRRAGEGLRVSEEQFRLLAQRAPVAIFLSDAEGGCVFVNETWCALAGMAADEAMGQGWLRAVHAGDRERVWTDWRRGVGAAETVTAEFRFERPDGAVSLVQGRAVQMHDEDGRLRGYIGALADITEQKRAEKTSALVAAIVESSDDAIFSKDLNGVITSWNRGAERLFGYTAAEAVGQSVTMLIPPERSAEEAEILRRIRAGERIEHYQTVRRHKDGTRREVSLTVSPLRDATGRIIGASKIAHDITVSRKQEQELGRWEKLYRAIGESIDYGIWVCDAAGRNIYASESFLRLVGLTQQECSEFGWGRVLHPDELAGTLAAWQACVATGAFWECEHRFKGVDGQWHPVLARGLPIREEDGRIAFWAGINLDISAFKRTEEALRRSEEQLRLVTDHAIVFLAQCDREHRLKFVNRPYAARFHREPRELVGKRLPEVIGEAAYAVVKPQIDVTLGGQRTEFEVEVPYEGMGKRWMRVIHEPERGADGAVVGVVAVITDITARKRAEAEMEEARDRAVAASRAKDDFLAALSHELRTPLNPVLLLASEAAADLTLPARVRADFGTIRKNVELEARLIDDLLDLTRITRGKLPLNFGPQDLHVIVRDALATLQAEFEEKKVGVRLELAATDTRVWGDAVRLQQVLWNVLKNAAKFTPPGGRATVRTRTDPEERCVSVEVRDSGIGMTAEERSRAFEAFSQGDHAIPGGSHRFGGVGLGLAISRRLVELHHGRIEATSDGRNQGTTVTVRLPLMEAASETGTGPAGGGVEAPAVAGTRAVVESALRRQRLLLVEDHEPTRTALARLLARRNYEVLTAGSVSEARAQAENGALDWLVSDIGLPDGNGYELMIELRGRQRLRGIALTGYGMDHDVVRSRAAGFAAHLTKPVTIQALEQALATRDEGDG